MTVPTRDDMQKAISVCRADDPREAGIRSALMWAAGFTTFSAGRFIEVQIEQERDGYRCAGGESPREGAGR